MRVAPLINRALVAVGMSLIALGGLAAATPTQAQVGFGFYTGPHYGYPVYGPGYRPVIERRVYRSYDVDDEEECRLIVRRRVTPWGEVITRRIRVCD